MRAEARAARAPPADGPALLELRQVGRQGARAGRQILQELQRLVLQLVRVGTHAHDEDEGAPAGGGQRGLPHHVGPAVARRAVSRARRQKVHHVLHAMRKARLRDVLHDGAQAAPRSARDRTRQDASALEARRPPEECQGPPGRHREVPPEPERVEPEEPKGRDRHRRPDRRAVRRAEGERREDPRARQEDHRGGRLKCIVRS